MVLIVGVVVACAVKLSVTYILCKSNTPEKIDLTVLHALDIGTPLPQFFAIPYNIRNVDHMFFTLHNLHKLPYICFPTQNEIS